MASELQRRKVAIVFNAMDVDADGFLTEADFEALAHRWTRGDPRHAGLAEIMMGWWETLLAASDRNRDNKVTLDEVLLVVDQLPDMLDAVTTTATAMFDATDENADNRISAAEYRRLIETWTGRPTDTDTVFPHLDRNADGYLSRDEFTAFWTEFWSGDDPTSPATHLFGPVPQPT